jgi:hypothetical protein
MNEIEKNLIEQLQKQTVEHNVLAQMAMAEGRSYIHPGDITEALEAGHSEDKVRLDTLEILAENAGFSCEDAGLIAWLAYKGKEE